MLGILHVSFRLNAKMPTVARYRFYSMLMCVSDWSLVVGDFGYTFRFHSTEKFLDESASKYAYVSGVSSLSSVSVRVLPEHQYAKNSAKYSKLLLFACSLIGAFAASSSYRRSCSSGKPSKES